MDASDNESLDLNETDFTIALWANFRKLEHITFVGKNEGSGKVNKWFFGVRYEWFEEGDLTLHINSPYMAGIWVASKSWSGEKDRWYQIVLVKTGKNYTFYVDGKEVYTFHVPEASLNTREKRTTFRYRRDQYGLPDHPACWSPI